MTDHMDFDLLATKNICSCLAMSYFSALDISFNFFLFFVTFFTSPFLLCCVCAHLLALVHSGGIVLPDRISTSHFIASKR